MPDILVTTFGMVYRIYEDFPFILPVGYYQDGVINTADFQNIEQEEGRWRREGFWNAARSLESEGTTPDMWRDMQIVTPCDCPRHNGQVVTHASTASPGYVRS